MGFLGFQLKVEKGFEFVPSGTEEAPILLLCIRNSTLPNYKLGSKTPVLLRLEAEVERDGGRVESLGLGAWICFPGPVVPLVSCVAASRLLPHCGLHEE